MLRYYETDNDNLGGAITSTLLFNKPIEWISVPDVQFDIQTGYSNRITTDGVLSVDGIEMTFNLGTPVTPTVVGLYILFNQFNDQQIVVDVTDLNPIALTLFNFSLEHITNDLFDVVSTQLAIDGGDRYRCIAIQNDGNSEFQSGKIWILNQVADGLISLGIDPSGVNGTPTTSDGVTPPVGVVFTTPVDEVSGIPLDNLGVGDHLFLWIKRNTDLALPDEVFRSTFDISGTYV